MTDGLFEYFTAALTYGFWFSVFASFMWGLLSILLSPCHLSSIPLVVGYLTSGSEASVKRTFSASILFALGILFTILITGVITAVTGRILGDIGMAGNAAVSVVFILIGLYLMDLIKLPISGLKINPSGKRSLWQPFILGLLFGLGLGPCTFAFMAPVLVIVFKMSSTSLLHGILMLLSFAAGHCLLIVLAGVSFAKVRNYLNWNNNSKVINIIKKITGLLVIAAGIYLFYNFVL